MTRISIWRVLLVTLYLASLTTIGYLFVEGLSYYRTPFALRPRHDLYWTLKPGGTLGILFGIAGSALMLLMLIYSLRKRVPFLRRVGALRGWLDFHIFCGIVGPLMIVLHTSFKVHGLVALSFWSMVVVALSGVVGRYLYLQIPRKRSGHEMTLAELEGFHREITERMRSEYGLGTGDIEWLDAVTAESSRSQGSLLAMILLLPVERIRLRRKMAGFRSRLRNLPPGLRREALRVARQRAVLSWRVRRSERLQGLFYYWHVFHKPFAVIMYLFMFVHIGVAIVTGYGWSSG